ncbi:MAG: metallopeptidase TldD-related protein [Bacillota bacterium]|jgi:PmbA protein
MSAAVETAEALARRLSEARGWRLVANSVYSVDVGMDDNKLCGHYRPPRAAGEVAGSVFIIWEDGTVSRGRIDSKTLARLPRDIELWRSLAYRDDDAAHIAELTPPTQVELFDPRVSDIVTDDAGPVFEAISQIAAAAREGGADVVDAGVGCSAVETVIATSNGLWVKYPETSVWCSWSIDKTMSGIRLGRDRETLAGLARAVSVAGRLALAARVRVKVDARDMRVVLTPRAAESFIGHYLLHNMLGENVAEGRSRYSLEQFREGSRVFRSDVSLVIDTAVPMGPGSYLCTSEGIPSGRAVLVEGGQLAAPILNIKYARRCQMAPTPIPASGMPPGHAGLTLRAENMEGWTELLSGADDVILVDSVLGMHTQDPTTGNFSLAVPDGIVVREGQYAGAAKVVISGNFMSAMNEADTRFALSDDDPNPGIELMCHVEG